MQRDEEYHSERLGHLGIVAGVCQEIGLAAWLDALAPDQQRVVSYGTATVAMILNGLGFSNRQLYLVPQFFENKPVAHLLGAGISADMRECSTRWDVCSIGSTSKMSPPCLRELPIKLASALG